MKGRYNEWNHLCFVFLETSKFWNLWLPDHQFEDLRSFDLVDSGVRFLTLRLMLAAFLGPIEWRLEPHLEELVEKRKKPKVQTCNREFERKNCHIAFH